MKMFFIHTLPRIFPVILVFSIGIFFRLYHFDTIPFGLHHDGALEGLEAIELSQSPLPYRPYSNLGWQGESLFRYSVAFMIHFFGPHAWVLKLTSTLWSLFTLFSLYFAAKILFGKQTALIVLVFFACSGWSIIMGKSVWRVVTFPFFLSLLLGISYAFFMKPSYGLSILLGFITACTINTYNSARVTPLFLLGMVYIFRSSIFSPHYRHVWKKLIIALGVSVLFLLPLIHFAIQNPDIFNSRSSFLFVGTKIAQQRSLTPLIDTSIRTLGLFTQRAYGDDFFTTQPLLEWPSAIVFIFGCIVCLVTIRKKSSQVLLLGMFVFLLPGILTEPNGNRAMGTMPFVYLLIGIGGATCIQILLKLRNRFVLYGVYAGVVLTVCTVCWQTYFGEHRRDIFGFYPETTVVGNYMKQRVASTDFYITDNFPRDTLTFLTYQHGSPYTKQYVWLERDTDFLTVKRTAFRRLIFVAFPNNHHEEVFRLLKLQYPRAYDDMLYLTGEGTQRPAAQLLIVEPSVGTYSE